MCFECVCVDTQTKQRASHFVSQFFCTVEVATLTCRIRYLKKEGKTPEKHSPAREGSFCKLNGL